MSISKIKGVMTLDQICSFSEEDGLTNDNEKALTKMPWLVAKAHPSTRNFEVYTSLIFDFNFLINLGI